MNKSLTSKFFLLLFISITTSLSADYYTNFERVKRVCYDRGIRSDLCIRYGIKFLEKSWLSKSDIDIVNGILEQLYKIVKELAHSLSCSFSFATDAIVEEVINEMKSNLRYTCISGSNPRVSLSEMVYDICIIFKTKDPCYNYDLERPVPSAPPMPIAMQVDEIVKYLPYGYEQWNDGLIYHKGECCICYYENRYVTTPPCGHCKLSAEICHNCLYNTTIKQNGYCPFCRGILCFSREYINQEVIRLYGQYYG